MVATKNYFQCRLQRLQRGTTSEQTAWIETRGAKVGFTVQLLPSREFWTVAEVFDHSLPEDMLKEHQLLNRHSLPSIEAI